MAKKTRYYILERDPDVTDAEHEDLFRASGAAQNLTLSKSGNNILIETDDVRPPLWAVNESPTPIGH